MNYVIGDIFCFFDDDDDMFPYYLEKFCAAFETFPRLKMVRCGMILQDGSFNFSYSTSECCLRAEFSTPIWQSYSSIQDQSYFAAIVSANEWDQDNSNILTLNQATCRANSDPHRGRAKREVMRDGGKPAQRLDCLLQSQPDLSHGFTVPGVQWALSRSDQKSALIQSGHVAADQHNYRQVVRLRISSPIITLEAKRICARKPSQAPLTQNWATNRTRER